MESIKLVEKMVVFPEKPTNRRRIFLSNIDLGLVAYQESVAFYDPPSNQMSFSESCQRLHHALCRLLVKYDFFAGRLVPSLEDSRRLEIDCNGAGAMFATATTETELSQLIDCMAPRPALEQFVAFLTQLKCGSLALTSRYNHCVLDGVGVREIQGNIAALTRGEELVIIPNPDRTIFRARNPPIVNHPHHEYSRGTDTDNLYTVHCRSGIGIEQCPNCLVYLSPHRIANLKKAGLGEGKLQNCTTFEVVAAKIWKTRSIALEMDDEKVSTMLFPVDTRKRMVPQAPKGFAGNALIPGFARARVRELKDEENDALVKKVREGVERLNDEYIRSSIDWLEVNKGVPCREESFSLVSWWRLGYEEDEFAWGKIKYSTPIVVKPGLVFLLPGPQGEGGLNICLELPEHQFEEFRRIMTED
ncbi:hypothetical protein RJ639_046352 [Escallonia herrerae]|uniref:Omega-hydroxypalmitate O-feruloyl transferase n=1 Tax=Escallonia herrerae TaxID=1293975 RepID=A0AA89B0D1_9ASTE|nr:hypothetical protein RJ639_046352 [Escallonia herrerae]